jgi:uncharacterized protein (UPF0218 family)
METKLMLKPIFCLLLFIITHLSLLAQPVFYSINKSNYKIDSLIIVSDDGSQTKHSLSYDGHLNIVFDLHQKRESPNNEWTNYYKQTYTYNMNDSLITYLEEAWDLIQQSWINRVRKTYNYDDNANLINLISERWSQEINDWEFSSQKKYKYNSERNRTEYLNQFWDRFTGSWQNKSRNLYEYNESNYLISDTFEDWEVTNEWIKEARGIYEFDNHGNLLIELWQHYHGGQQYWINDRIFKFIYNDRNLQLTKSISNWDYLKQKWVNEDSTIYTYNNNLDLTNEYNLNWNVHNSRWEPYDYKSYTYGLEGNLKSKLTEIWDTTVGQWKNLFRDSLEIEDDNFTLFVNEKFTDTGWEPNSNYPIWYRFNDKVFAYGGTKIFYFFSKICTDIPETGFYISQNYPNPFNPITTIIYQIPNESFVSLKIFNSIGEQIATLINEVKTEGLHEVNFDANNLPSGVYFYQINAGRLNQVRKMLLLK